ncbi:MAG TPA: hypothetical protein VJ486_11355 [Geothrix sp.]|nr:hypothetical protein [Geothrix sp.]
MDLLRFLFLAVAGFLLQGCAPGLTAPTSHQASQTTLGRASKAIWVWEAETLRLLEDRAFEAQAVDLLRAHHFRTLYLYADDYRGRNPILNERASCRGLLRRLHEAGLRVEALLGSYPLKTWEYVLPERDQPARAMLQHVLDFNAGAPVEERFDGIHLDIEPYVLDTWNETTRIAISRLYLDRSREWVAMARQADRSLIIGAAIPFWYDGFEVEWEGMKRPLNAHVQGIYDYVALMDYRNQAEGPDGIIAHARDEMAYASASGKRVVIGLETGEAEPAKLTFRHLGAEAMAREIATTTRAFHRETAFAGFAIHHLQTWMELISKVPVHPATLPSPGP